MDCASDLMISAPRAGYIASGRSPVGYAEHSIRVTSFGAGLLRAHTARAGIALDPLPSLATRAADRVTPSHLPSAASPVPIMSALATISGSGRPTRRASLFVYGNAARKCRMQFRRARFLSSDLTIVHGASAVSV